MRSVAMSLLLSGVMSGVWRSVSGILCRYVLGIYAYRARGCFFQSLAPYASTVCGSGGRCFRFWRSPCPDTEPISVRS